MSINPVEAISQLVEARLANARPAQPPAPVEAQADAPNAGSPPKEEVKPKQNASSSSELPQDEVHVQRDSQTNDDVVVKYMDHAGNVILQVPTTQVLGLARAINQDFRAEEKARTLAVENDNKGGNTHGH